MPRQSNSPADSPHSCSCAAQYQAKIEGLIRQLEAARKRIYELSLQMSSFNAGCLNNPQAEKGSAFNDLLSLLTNREREVALLFMEVANDKSVARELGIALQTVRNQIASIQNKLHINSREELILLLLSMQRSQDYFATRA